MNGTKTFFKEVQSGKMTLGSIFSEVFQKHTREQTAQVFIAGTALTTPDEKDMLSGWQKPYLFARFFLCSLLVTAAMYFQYLAFGHPLGIVTLLLAGAFCTPMAWLLFTWEMNVPRNISLYEVLGMCALGGALSLVATLFGYSLFSDGEAWLGAFVEEPAKLLIVYYYIKKKDSRFILNGILIGMAVGVGFQIMENIYYIFCLNTSLETALVRALKGMSSHGTYTALYGGALVMVKGKEALQFKCLKDPRFIRYFLIAVGIHAFNNLDIDLFAENTVYIKILLVFLISLPVLLGLMKKGVNQVVEMSAGLNGGSVTRAVKVEAAPAAAHAAPSAESVSAQPFAVRDAAGTVYHSDSRERITFGRDLSCTVNFSGIDPAVSGRHCELYRENGKLYLRDTSSNGTLLGKCRLESNIPHPVQKGMAFSLVSQKNTFVIVEG